MLLIRRERRCYAAAGYASCVMREPLEGVMLIRHTLHAAGHYATRFRRCRQRQRCCFKIFTFIMSRAAAAARYEDMLHARA